jgi:hypothetical protein
MATLRTATLLVALAGTSIVTSPVVAEICTVDAVPSSTLLLPYFEVDLEFPNGVTTIFTIGNASSDPVLAEVVLWTDLGIPVLTFQVPLTGYEVQPINLRDVFYGEIAVQDIVFGNLSREVPVEQSDPCTFLLCPEVDPIEQAAAACTGNAIPGLANKCGGTRYYDSLARGYATIVARTRAHGDRPESAVLILTCEPYESCIQCPSDDEEPEGCKDYETATRSENVLFGEFIYVESSRDYAQGGTLVNIEADELAFETSQPGQNTFNGRFVDWTAADHQEPLATTFAARYLQNTAFTGGTDLIVWRDPKEIIEPFDCDLGPPPPFPLGQEAIVIFDEHENVDIQPSLPISPQPEGSLLNPFPWATQRVKVGGPALPVLFDAGWLYLNLNAGNINGNPPEDPFASQNWVTVLQSAEGRYSVGFDAIQLDSACNANHLDPDENPALTP